MAKITKEFLEKVFKEEIENFKLNSGSNIGDGHTSTITTIDVTFKSSQLEQYFVLKTFPSHPARQEFLAKANIFWKELSVYEKLVPELVKFQGSETSRGFIKPPFPQFVFGQAINYNFVPIEEVPKMSADPLQNCVMLVDLRKSFNFRLANRLHESDLDHMTLIMVAYAKLHALSWTYKVKSGATCLADKLPFLAESFFDKIDHEMFKKIFANSHDLFRSVIESLVKVESEKVNLMEALDGATEKSLDMMSLYFSDGRTLSSPSMNKDNCLRVPGLLNENEEPWLVALHGDAHINNMLFRYDDQTNRPTEVILLDHQGTREGDPLTDLTKIIFTSTTSKFRREHLDDLLLLYLTTFADICTQFQIPLPRDFNMAELKRRFHRAKMLGFVVCLMALPYILNDPEDAIDLDKLKEDTTQDEMLNELASLTKNVKNNRNFNYRVLDVVRELYNEGVI